MLPIFDAIRDMNDLSVVLRLLIAFACGGLIGLERSYKNRPAGFRTHILVCIGAATAAMTGQYLYLVSHLPTDMSRIGAQVITGLGFIGGGTIMVTKNKTVKGLTTAAGLWAAGVVGLAVGSGFYEGGILATFMIIFVEVCFANVSKMIKHTPEFNAVVQYTHKEALNHVLRYCKDTKMSITNLQITGNATLEVPVYTAIVSLRPDGNISRGDFFSKLREKEGVVFADEL
ncbi:MAG: MgtC/SapB family protein [Eubacterium sp.]|nr:MgtC/SapB family protein [Eubacterium sp.]